MEEDGQQTDLTLVAERSALLSSGFQLHGRRGDAEDWEVEVDGVEEPDLLLLESQYPKSIGPGCVDYPDLPTVDIIQAALDVVHSPSGSQQQARVAAVVTSC